LEPLPSPPDQTDASALRRLIAAARRPLQSLPSRIVLSVFGAALATSLTVALVSTSSIEAFLRAEIDQKFPAVLRSASERLDLWYAQRRLDIETFARSATVIDNASRLGPESSPAARARALGELEQYLEYVLERFPQFEALFLLDDEGHEVLRVGLDTPIPEGLRAELAGVVGSVVGGVHALPGGRIQVASAPIVDARQTRRASLHAQVRMESVLPVLHDDEFSASTAVYVVDRSGKTLFQSPGSEPRAAYDRRLPEMGDEPAVDDYRNAGAHVVGSAVRFARFGWTMVVEEDYAEAFAPEVAVMRRIVAINLGIVILFGLAAYQFARSIVRPIKALSDGAQRIADGETDVVVPLPSTQDEIEVLTRVFNEMSDRLHANQLELERSREEIERANGRLVSQNNELQRVNEVLEQLSITDGLTKLHNHRYFQDHLRRELKRTRRTGEPLVLVLIDIDDFKQLNDRCGHAAGDTVLREVAAVMNGALRETDLLARYGGEEFALVASRTDLEGARALCEKLRIAVAEARFQLEGEKKPLSVTVSVGAAAFSSDEKSLFRDADRALYEAKHAGKDCVVVASPSDAG
jgi:diguanylate cyclase (GGDEF)-like protein